MSQELIKHIKANHRDMVSERENWVHIWREIAELMVPRKSNILGNTQVYRERKRFDATAMNAVVRLATSITGNMTPQTSEWFEISTGLERSLGQGNASTLWASTVTEIMHNTLRQSNFQHSLQETLIDMISLGTGAIIETVRPPQRGLSFPGIEFESWPLQSYFISEGHNEQVNRIHRLRQMTLEQVEARFGVDAMPDSIKDIRKHHPLRSATILHAIFDRPQNMVLDPRLKRFPVSSVFILTNDLSVRETNPTALGTEQLPQITDTILEVGGFREFPVFVGRWAKVSGEVLGRGPGMTALPDVQVLNEADRLGLMAWANGITPPLQVQSEGVIGKPDLRPLRINTVTEQGAIDFLRIPSDVNQDLVRRQEKQASIREIFFMDQVNFLPDRGLTPPTAFEIQSRFNIMLQLMGPTLHRFEFEILQPLINRTFQLLQRAGQLPPPPADLLQQAEAQGGQLDINFVGPIARARAQADDAAADKYIQQIFALGQINPDALQIHNVENMIRHQGRVNGVPQNFYKTQDEIEEQKEQQAQAVAQQQQLEQAALAGEAAKNLQAAEVSSVG